MARRTAAWLALGLLLWVPAGSRADAGEGPYAVKLAIDVPVAGAAAVAWLVPPLFVKDLVTPSCPCAKSDVNAFDRGVAGRKDDTVALVSDIGIVLLVAAPFALDALDVHARDEPVTSFLRDTLVVGEAILVSGAFDTGFKLAVARPRPFLYGRPATDPLVRDAGNYVSFYSGHASIAFAAGMSYAETFALRHPDSPYRWLVYLGAGTAGAGIATLRVLAGRHFPSDVLVGAAAGSAVGLLVPFLHARGAGASVAASPLPGGLLLALGGVWR